MPRKKETPTKKRLRDEYLSGIKIEYPQWEKIEMPKEEKIINGEVYTLSGIVETEEEAIKYANTMEHLGHRIHKEFFNPQNLWCVYILQSYQKKRFYSKSFGKDTDLYGIIKDMIPKGGALDRLGIRDTLLRQAREAKRRRLRRKLFFGQVSPVITARPEEEQDALLHMVKLLSVQEQYPEYLEVLTSVMYSAKTAIPPKKRWIFVQDFAESLSRRGLIAERYFSEFKEWGLRYMNM